MTIQELKENLEQCYSKDLCNYKVQKSWNSSNKSLGMGDITSLIVQDYFGGDICKIRVGKFSHYFNKVDNEVFDLTKEQFKVELQYDNYEVIGRTNLLNDYNLKRYFLLKNKAITLMLSKIDALVSACRNCNGLVEKFPNSKTVFLGKDNDIVLIGEAPANNGWRKSHKLWKDVHGKTLPSGVVLQKLFDIVDRDIFETTFLEAVKCYPVIRKNLKTCSKNCREIMLKQLEILNPKLIITLGEFPTRNLLDFKFDRFRDVVGNIYKVDSWIIIPIYHPSPISPNSYKGNVPIFTKMKDYL